LPVEGSVAFSVSRTVLPAVAAAGALQGNAASAQTKKRERHVIGAE
jgi:hypothetical protein